jgi:hypothetical protein
MMKPNKKNGETLQGKRMVVLRFFCSRVFSQDHHPAIERTEPPLTIASLSLSPTHTVLTCRISSCTNDRPCPLVRSKRQEAEGSRTVAGAAEGGGGGGDGDDEGDAGDDDDEGDAGEGGGDEGGGGDGTVGGVGENTCVVVVVAARMPVLVRVMGLVSLVLMVRLLPVRIPRLSG